jgi:hypothetical protein
VKKCDVAAESNASIGIDRRLNASIGTAAYSNYRSVREEHVANLQLNLPNSKKK